MNFYSQYERALEENGVTREQVVAYLDANPKFRSPFYKAKHVYCGNNADVVAAVAPYITKTRADITIIRELRALKKNAPKHEATLDAAAEE